MRKTMPTAEQLSMRNVCRLFKRNHIFYQVEDHRILFKIRRRNRIGERIFSFIGFEEGRTAVGRQTIIFGTEEESIFEGDGTLRLLRETVCTDMAFFAFHLHDLHRDVYPTDEYNDWY